MNNKVCVKNQKPPKKKWKKKLSKRLIKETGLVSTAATGGVPQSLPLIAHTFDLNCDFAQSLSREYRMFRHLLNDIIDSQQKRIQDSERELDEMKKYYINLKMEEAEMKRKRWCSQCQMEATYISDDRHYFYCTTTCEQVACSHQVSIDRSKEES